MWRLEGAEMNCQVSGLIEAILLKGLPTVFQSLSGPNMDSPQSSFIKLQVKEQKHFCNPYRLHSNVLSVQIITNLCLV